MNSFLKAVRLSVVALPPAVGATSAQTGGGTTAHDNRDAGWSNLAWLGLLGLEGLIPLFTRRNGVNGNHTHHTGPGNTHRNP